LFTKDLRDKRHPAGIRRFLLKVFSHGVSDEIVRWPDGQPRARGRYKVPDEFLQANFGKNANDLIAVDQAVGHCESQ
jgi:hypothetical protein